MKYVVNKNDAIQCTQFIVTFSNFIRVGGWVYGV